MQPQRSGSQQGQAVGRTRRRRLCAGPDCDALYEVPEPWPHPWPRRFCSTDCHRRSKAAEALGKPRRVVAPLRSSTTSTKRRPVAVASPEQRAKRAMGASIVSAATEGLDAAHLTPRPLGGCDDPACIVPLTRAEHRAFDAGQLDLLPHLVTHQCVTEMAHMLAHYQCDVIAMLERLTGCRVVLEDRRAA